METASSASPRWREPTLKQKASLENTSKVWNAKFGEKLFDSNEDWVDCMPGTDLVVTSSTDKGKIWNTKSGEMLFDLTGLEESIMCITSVPGTTYLVVTGSLYNTGKVWNAKSGEMLFDLTGHDGREWKLTAVLGMQMEGRSLIVDGLVDGFILVWQASTGEMLVPFHIHRCEMRFCASARPPWCPFPASPAVIQMTMARQREAAAKQQRTRITSCSGGRTKASRARHDHRYSERCATVTECHKSTIDCHYRPCFCKMWSPCLDQPKRCAGCGHGAICHDSALVADHGSLTLQEESQGNATGQGTAGE